MRFHPELLPFLTRKLELKGNHDSSESKCTHDAEQRGESFGPGEPRRRGDEGGYSERNRHQCKEGHALVPVHGLH